MRRHPSAAAAGVVGHDVDDVRVRATALEQHAAGLRLRVVTPAQRAAPVEDLPLDAIERAGEQHARDRSGSGGSQISFSLSVSLTGFGPWMNRVVIFTCFLPRLQTSRGSGPVIGTRMVVGVVQRSGSSRVSRALRFDAGLQGLEVGVELRIAVVLGVIDRDRVHAVRACSAAGRRCCCAHTPICDERTAPFTIAVGVAVGIAVGAAAPLRLARRIVHRCVEHQQAVGPRAAAAAEDGRARRGPQRRTRAQRDPRRARTAESPSHRRGLAQSPRLGST